MKANRKSMLLTAAALGLASSLALAAPGSGDCRGGHGWGGMHGGAGPRGERMEARQEARLDRLQTYLQLKPEQQEAWQTFRAAMDAHHDAKRKAWEGRRAEAGALAHFDQRIQFMETHLATLKTVAKAAGELYSTLSPEQKAVMDDFFGPRQAGPKESKT